MQDSSKRVGGLVALAVGLLIVSGCSGKYTPVPVDGVVTLDGKPVEAATVYFYVVGDDKEGRVAQGTTDKAGKFHLTTMSDGDGALCRNYKVVIHKYVPNRPNIKIPENLRPEERANFMYNNFEAKGIQPFVNSLPARYGDINSTPLECNVTGRMTVKFELTNK